MYLGQGQVRFLHYDLLSGAASSDPNLVNLLGHSESSGAMPGFFGFKPNLPRESVCLRHVHRYVVDWSTCLEMMDGCDRMATWYARVLHSNECRSRYVDAVKSAGKRLNFVHLLVAKSYGKIRPPYR